MAAKFLVYDGIYILCDTWVEARNTKICSMNDAFTEVSPFYFAFVSTQFQLIVLYRYYF